MGCGCADRMRKYVLPTVGYTRTGSLWVHPTREPIPDAEVESHHSRLTLEIVKDEMEERARVGRERAKGLFRRLNPSS